MNKKQRMGFEKSRLVSKKIRPTQLFARSVHKVCDAMTFSRNFAFEQKYAD